MGQRLPVACGVLCLPSPGCAETIPEADPENAQTVISDSAERSARRTEGGMAGTFFEFQQFCQGAAAVSALDAGEATSREVEVLFSTAVAKSDSGYREVDETHVVVSMLAGNPHNAATAIG
jgi:hypothetical protein